MSGDPGSSRTSPGRVARFDDTGPEAAPAAQARFDAIGADSDPAATVAEFAGARTVPEDATPENTAPIVGDPVDPGEADDAEAAPAPVAELEFADGPRPEACLLYTSPSPRD